MPELEGSAVNYEDFILASGGVAQDTTPDQLSEYELPDNVNRFHTYDDRDTPQGSHHTLGKGQFQSSPGPHTHNGKNSLLLSSDPVMAPVNVFSTTDTNGLSNTTYSTPTNSVGLTFKAPPSGRGLIIWRARVDFVFSAGATVIRHVRAAPKFRNGSSIGSGSDPNKLEGSEASPNDDISAGSILGDVTGTDGVPPFNGIVLVSGLTPNADYNAELQLKCNSATTFTYNVVAQMIGWIPLP